MPEVGAVPPSYHLNSSNPKGSPFPPPGKKTLDSAFDSRIYFCMSSTAARLTVSRLQSRIASSTCSSTSRLLFRRTSSFTLLPVQTRFKSTMSSDQQIIFSKDAAAPVGPYSQAIKTPFAIFCSGQIPLGPDGVLVDGSITDQTRKCCENAEAVLKEAGSSIPRVVKTMIFISDMAHFAEMNTEYEKWFSHKPARSCVAVKTLPKNVDVEIEVVALP